MSLRPRLNRLSKRVGARASEPGPQVVVLTEAVEGRVGGRRERKNSAGHRVLEIAFDPKAEPGPIPLPPGPYKLIMGCDPVDMV